MDGFQPTRLPILVETIIVAGVAAPGIASVSGAEWSYKWDVKEAKGSSGATTTYQGEEVAKPEVELQLWKDGTDEDGVDHFAEWDAFRVILRSGQSAGAKSVKALEVLHPYLTDAEIFSAGVTKIGQLVHAGKGLYKVKFGLIAYKPAKPAGGTPKGGWTVDHGKGGQGGGQSAKDENDQQIDKLIAKAKAA